MSSCYRIYVFLIQKIGLLDTENMSSRHRKYVLFRQNICFLHIEKIYYKEGGGEVTGSIPGRCADEKMK